MSGKITNAALESRLKCRYKGCLKMSGEQGLPHDYDFRDPSKPSPLINRPRGDWHLRLEVPRQARCEQLQGCVPAPHDGGPDRARRRAWGCG